MRGYSEKVLFSFSGNSLEVSFENNTFTNLSSTSVVLLASSCRSFTIANLSIEGSNILASLVSASSVDNVTVRGLAIRDSTFGETLIKLINIRSSAVIEDIKVTRVSTTSESSYFLDVLDLRSVHESKY